MQISEGTTWTLIKGYDYPRHLSGAINQSSRRVVLTALVGFYDPSTKPIFDAAREALKRGVKVHLVFDALGLFPLSTGPIIPKWSYFAQRSKTVSMYQEFRELGAQVTILNSHRRVQPNIFAHRFHAKMAVVDDVTYSFGGLNLCDESFRAADYMLNRRDVLLSDHMEKLMADFSHGHIKQDMSIEIDSGEAILFDAGNPKVSLIYSTAQQLTRQASKVWYVSKMCPGFQLAADLLATENFCYFNTTQQSSFPTNIAQAIDSKRAGVSNLYTGEAYIHGKFMLFEMRDGSRISLTGSHNFSWRGVKYGTQEIALLSKNTSLWSRLYAYLHEYS